MGDNPLIQVIPKSINDAAGNILNPPTKGIGSTLADLWFLAFGGISEAAEKKKLRIATHLMEYQEELKQAVYAIPPERLTETKFQVAGYALEKSKYCVEEKELRDMFTKLIARSMDLQFQNLVHPSFPEIISQMSPLDAENLSLFYSSETNTPVCLPIASFDVSFNDHQQTAHRYVFLENNSADDVLLQATSISSLVRLGLINVNMGLFLKPELYRKFRECSAYSELIESISKEKSAHVNQHWGIVELTPLGEVFVQICLK